MKKTIREIIQFNNFATNWVAQNGVETKLKYAVNRMIKRTDPIKEKAFEELENARIDNCSVDERGNILREEGNPQLYKFTKDGLKALNKRSKEIYSDEIEFEQYIATQLPEDLDEVIRQIFTGFVIKETGDEGKEESEMNE